MKTRPYIVGKCRRTATGTEVRCACGGQVAVDAAGYYQTPIGFGFRGNKFVVDTRRQSGWFGECLTCRRAVFAPKPQARARVVTRVPHGINAKIRQARGAQPLRSAHDRAGR